MAASGYYKYFLFFFYLIMNTDLYAQGANPESSLIEKAKSIHNQVITIDTHCDIDVKNFQKNRNYTQTLSSQMDLPKMTRGGLDVAWFIVFTAQGKLTDEGYKKGYENTLQKFEAIHRLTENYAPDKIELALSSADVKRIHASGKKVAMIGIENAYPLGNNLTNIQKFYDLGGRYLSLAHQGHSQFSDSNTGEKDGIWLYNNGLSELGKQAIAEMNRVGMMIDVSHPSKGAFLEMIRLSKAPVIASHSSARALCDHSRNLDDEQLLLIKQNGGVVQTVAFDGYVNMKKDNAHKSAQDKVLKSFAQKQNFAILTWPEKQELSAEDLKKYEETLAEIKVLAKDDLAKAAKQAPPVNVADFVDHIDYMVKLMGIDHVGISSDFDGGGGVKGWNDASETFNVTLELVKRGYSEEEIAKFWGQNLLRVMDEVQAFAASMK
jgi:microsomal dipeptidase-like Zn-dependent dipeptidase